MRSILRQQWEDSAQQWPERIRVLLAAIPILSTEKRRLQMNKFRFTINILAIAAFTLAVASLAQAQATRTWVSGVGDDANPCSRTAPCKTFAGAISKTATNGIIDVLDPGGFGAVTITKAITIDGGPFEAGVLASGTNGIIINAPNTATVTLRHLDIEGIHSGLTGVKILNGGARRVFILDCEIYGWTTRGLSDERNTGGFLYVANTRFRDNAAGAVVAPTSGSAIVATFDWCVFEGNDTNGLVASNGSVVTATNCTAFGNDGAGFRVEGAIGATLNLQLCIASNNSKGVQAAAGTAKISNVQITNNATGLDTPGGQISSYGNNNITANGAGNGPPNGPGITIQ
jgi:hypothetical protein